MNKLNDTICISKLFGYVLHDRDVDHYLHLYPHRPRNMTTIVINNVNTSFIEHVPSVMMHLV